MADPGTRTREHLANERTFLAWIRTSVALMGFGFVIVKFAVFLRQAAIVYREQLPDVPKSYSAEIGTGMVFFGAVVAVLGYINFKRGQGMIEKGDYTTTSGFNLLITLLIVLAGLLLIWYLLPHLH